ncbi:MAG: sugar phosphate isomerase/epimerase family protein [Kiritimatiellia bacterium]
MSRSIALSSHWNAFRHADGEALLEEILEASFTEVELGYDLRLDLVPGVQKMVESRSVRIVSVHNYCPVPLGAPAGHPELFLPASLDTRERQGALRHTMRTVDFAAEVGAGCVIVHAGRVRMRNFTDKLLALRQAGKQYDPQFERVKLKLLMQREKKVQRHLDALCAWLEEILPFLERNGVTLALENLPTWESIPTEAEMEKIHARVGSPLIGYWHDTGHGQLREDLGVVSQRYWLERLQGLLRGMHLHDVDDAGCDHRMPPEGRIDFSCFRKFVRSDSVLVLEPAPGTPREAVVRARDLMREAFELP